MPSHARERAMDAADGASLAGVRIALGTIGTFSMARLILYGWVGSRYAGPEHRFTYPGLGWVPRLALGPATALVVVLVGFAWIETLDATTYLNHYWFVTLLAGLMVFLPGDAALSVRARLHGPRTVPLGCVWLVRFQVGVVYVFAAVAKLHGDW